MLNGKSLLVTGGTGSFGQAFVRIVLERYPDIRRLVVFSRDELKQFEMAQQFSRSQYPQLRFFIGDVRDAERLKRAMEASYRRPRLQKRCGCSTTSMHQTNVRCAERHRRVFR